MAEGSQTFEQDIARLITQELVSRDEGLLHADSPTNLLWRLQNDQTPVSRVAARKEESETATYTELSYDMRAEDSRPPPGSEAPWAPKR